ncbi:hypothetical protein GGTG_06533 [Gaeumannomyces tritici R3-111a-1]|uniref:Uncharacterized protein n=1 Tax=Gaeumannomyces tritici (strain R3-111a-1) TaxID=644352 RepID=J3NZ33_GAET3|nr:hypothetical protein GGTG_06533 [Gaeumannomyces tritici R3-111a-1]EJT76616.1 hypothetical protein GGTG_06533 [Gaeumannomyces tritici R3-111a-1]
MNQRHRLAKLGDAATCAQLGVHSETLDGNVIPNHKHCMTADSQAETNTQMWPRRPRIATCESPDGKFESSSVWRRPCRMQRSQFRRERGGHLPDQTLSAAPSLTQRGCGRSVASPDLPTPPPAAPTDAAAQVVRDRSLAATVDRRLAASPWLSCSRHIVSQGAGNIL